MQMYKWINSYTVKTMFINFCMYDSNTQTNNSSNTLITPITHNIPYNPDEFEISPINPNILVDTGSSLPNRKYTNEILEIFARYEDIPFKLQFKTFNNIYVKHNLSKYEQFKNINIINKTLQIDDLNRLYKETKFFLYLSRYDGYGISLANAMNKNMFIFCLDGLPWNEMLMMYPRKIYIKSIEDGMAKSQIKYKADFNDLKNKLYNIDEYVNIINNTENETNDFNIINKMCFQTNINNFFKYIFNKDKAEIDINLNNKVLENVFINYYKNNKVLNLNNIYSNYLQLQN